MHYKIVSIGYSVSSKDPRNQKPNGLFTLARYQQISKLIIFLTLILFFHSYKMFDYLLKLIIFAS